MDQSDLIEQLQLKVRDLEQRLTKPAGATPAATSTPPLTEGSPDGNYDGPVEDEELSADEKRPVTISAVCLEFSSLKEITWLIGTDPSTRFEETFGPVPISRQIVDGSLCWRTDQWILPRSD